MTMRTLLPAHRQNKPTSDPINQMMLGELRELTGLNWQVTEDIEVRGRWWFKTKRTVCRLYVEAFPGECMPFVFFPEVHCAVTLRAFLAGHQEAVRTTANSNNPSAAAIAYALEQCDGDHDAVQFLHYWNEGDFDVLRRNWENIPDSVFVGADSQFNSTETEEEDVRGRG